TVHTGSPASTRGNVRRKTTSPECVARATCRTAPRASRIAPRRCPFLTSASTSTSGSNSPPTGARFCTCKNPACGRSSSTTQRGGLDALRQQAEVRQQVAQPALVRGHVLRPAAALAGGLHVDRGNALLGRRGQRAPGQPRRAPD